ncbi:glucosamine-6-phosphate deaminase [Alkalicoccus luteus]|uniref:glucosamine-6-phosphate deaminase n=1 Tax=Alkalicoccus luteus TaxID=1237094 RepID=UPI00403411E5
MNIIETKNYEDMSEAAAGYVWRRLQSGMRVLGLATGGTPIRFYERLTKQINHHSHSLKELTTVNLDEYIGLGATHPNSYHVYMQEHFFKHVDIPMEHAYLPDGKAASPEKEADDYEKLVTSLGIELQLLGIGANGHIGFNEPGSPFDGKSRVVDLTEETIEANARFFEKEEQVPRQAVTMGIGTIMKAEEILLLASGAEKAEAVRDMIEGPVTEEVPATVLQRHPNVTVIADREALSLTHAARSVFPGK